MNVPDPDPEPDELDAPPDPPAPTFDAGSTAHPPAQYTKPKSNTQ